MRRQNQLYYKNATLLKNALSFFVSQYYRCRRQCGEEITFTARPKINSNSQTFMYGRSIFCLPHFQISLIYAFIGCPYFVALALKLWFYVPTYQLRLDLSVHGKSVAKVAYRTENTNDDIFLHDIGQKRPSWVFIFLQV